MAHDLKLSHVAASAGIDAVLALLNGGFIDIYDGAKPANANIAVGSQVRLANLQLGTPAFAPAVAGIAVANPIGPCLDNDANGTASWARLRKSDHSTAVLDLTVGQDAPGGPANCDINLDNINIQIHAQTTILTLMLQLPE
jgi:hypothetical protein